MSRPLIVRKVGSAWEVYLDVPAAFARVPRRMHERLRRFPYELVPLARKEGGKVSLEPGGTPARLRTKDEAMRFAHHIGRYLLDMGDFVDTYTSVEKGGGTASDRFRGRGLTSRDPDSRLASELRPGDRVVAKGSVHEVVAIDRQDRSFVLVLSNNGIPSGFTRVSAKARVRIAGQTSGDRRGRWRR